MKKILLIGKLNKVVQNLNDCLAEKFNVQICAESTELIKGMMKIVKPNMVILCAMEIEDMENGIFDFLQDSYPDLPVLGIEKESGKHQEYYEKKQFTCMLSPISKEKILEKCCDILKIRLTESGEVIPVIEYEERDQKQIMVVDDSALALRSMKSLLEKKYEVLVATSGKQALKMIKKNHPDLILLDYEMPGYDGRETLEMIREDEYIRDIPVIFLTSVADKDHIAAVLRLNPAGYFLKPPEREKLLEAIDAILQ